MASKTQSFLQLWVMLIIVLRIGVVVNGDQLSAFQTYRTAYHFQPPKNWMNDPAGPMVFRNIYHLFYQYVTTGVQADGTKVWGHSISLDLVNWTPLPIALSPSQKGDIFGCWTGSTTILQGGTKPAILYTGILDTNNIQSQNVAFPKDLSDPYLIEWIKPAQDPILLPDPPNQPNGINGSSFRDPTTAWLGRDGRWRMVVGNKIGRQGRALLYSAGNDFVNWTIAQNPLHSANDTGMWECPDFYPVTKSQIGLDTSLLNGFGVKDVLKVSLDDTRHDVYLLGSYDNVKNIFIPDAGSVEGDSGLRYDYGKFYAAKTFYDSLKKRRVLWGWINESLSIDDYVKQGWSGIQGIPRIVWLDKSGKQLKQWPIYEIESLRENQVSLPWTLLKGGSIREIYGVNASQADVEVTFDLFEILYKAEEWNSSWTDPQKVCTQMDASVAGGIGPFGLKVLASNDSEEYTAVFFRVYRKDQNYVVLMCSDQSKSSLNPNPDKANYGLILDMDIGVPTLSLRTLIDHSVVESFGEKGRGCITSRVYPTKALNENAHLYVFNNGREDIIIRTLSAWTMKNALIN